MQAAEVIALVSVVSGAVVSVGTPWITARLGLSRFELETSRGREEELREHLDQATLRVSEARLAVLKAMRALSAVDAQHARSVATQAYDSFGLVEQLRSFARTVTA